MNTRAFGRAYGVFSPALQGRIGFDAWSSGLTSTHESEVVVSVIEPGAGDALQVSTAFTSRQAPDAGPSPGEGCTHWTLIYVLVPSPGGTTPYRIDAVRDRGPGHTAC